MTAMPNHAAAADPFLAAFRGSFTSALRWPQLDALWERVRERADLGWYLYHVGDPPPVEPADAIRVLAFVAEIDALLRAEHKEDYCGIVYADDPAAPGLIKIYDPHQPGRLLRLQRQPAPAGLGHEPAPSLRPARCPGADPRPPPLVAAGVWLGSGQTLEQCRPCRWAGAANTPAEDRQARGKALISTGQLGYSRCRRASSADPRKNQQTPKEITRI